MRRSGRYILNGLGVLSAGLILIAACVAVNRQSLLISWRLVSIHGTIARGEQGWADESMRMLRILESETPDKRFLARKLVHDSDPSVVSEGLLLMERTSDPRLPAELARFSKDPRWTWHLISLADVCQEITSRCGQQAASGAADVNGPTCEDPVPTFLIVSPCKNR